MRDIKIATIGFPPYGISEQGVLSGIYYEAANMLVKEAGYNASNIITPYARIKSGLKTGQSDMTIMFKYPELEEFVTYVAPFPSLKIVVLGLHSSVFTSLKDLKGIRLGYLRGASFSDAIDRDPDVIIHRTTDFLQGVKMLLAGHVEAIIGPMDPILSTAAKIGMSEEVFGVPLIIDERTPWIQVSNKSLLVLSPDKLKISFEKIKKRGVLKELRKKYLRVREVNNE
ncbi:MAG: transporter substrate-binding domain-containing protein [Bermanella sp.]